MAAVTEPAAVLWHGGVCLHGATHTHTRQDGWGRGGLTHQIADTHVSKYPLKLFSLVRPKPAMMLFYLSERAKGDFFFFLNTKTALICIGW